MKYIISIMLLLISTNTYADLDEVRVKDMLRDIRNNAMEEKFKNKHGENDLYYDGYIQATSDVMVILNFVKN